MGQLPRDSVLTMGHGNGGRRNATRVLVRLVTSVLWSVRRSIHRVVLRPQNGLLEGIYRRCATASPIS